MFTFSFLFFFSHKSVIFACLNARPEKITFRGGTEMNDFESSPTNRWWCWYDAEDDWQSAGFSTVFTSSIPWQASEDVYLADGAGLRQWDHSPMRRRTVKRLSSGGPLLVWTRTWARGWQSSPPQWFIFFFLVLHNICFCTIILQWFSRVADCV